VTDALGSVNALTSTSGSVQNTYLYDAWGLTRTQTGSLANPFTYTARETGEAGSMFYRARYLSPGVGRFLSEDPFSLRPGSLGADIGKRATQDYGYVFNNPVSYVDPSGEIAQAAASAAACALLDGPLPIGDLIAVGIITIAIIDTITDGSESCADCPKKPCPPCNPPVGTIGYRYTPGSRPHWAFKTGDHVHLYRMNQNPNNCRCFWQPIGVTAPPPPPGAVPLPSLGGR
jgi:RHS repeat-associated protein